MLKRFSKGMDAIGDTLPAAKATVLAVRKPERLISLDVYRGLTIAGMILVADPGSVATFTGRCCMPTEMDGR